MTDDIVARLRDGEPDRCHGCSEWVCDGELSREEMGGADCDCDCHRWAHLVREAADVIERLRRWKVEATAVLEGWDAVWECAGRGTLGESKQRGVIARLGELDDEIERLRGDNARLSLDLMTALGELMEARRG